MEKLLKILTSWWIESAAIGVVGLMLLTHSHKLYAGIAFGWAACVAIKKLKQMAIPTKPPVKK
jgi:hypothetical protein